MENNILETLVSNLVGIVTAAGVIIVAYYKFVIEKKTGDQKTIAQLQEHVGLLMDRDAKKDKTISDLQEQNVLQISSVQTLTFKLDSMEENFSELKDLLEKEKKEKSLYQEKYRQERYEKMRVLEENEKMIRDIEKLKDEVRTLKSQLGMQID